MSSDSFAFKAFSLRQERCAMKVGTDGVVLGAWAAMPAVRGGNVLHALDIGTGTGLIALMLAQRYPDAQVTGIDIDAEAARQAGENAVRSPFRDRVAIIHSPLQSFDGGPFDAIVCNPPFYTGTLKGKDDRRNVCRHAVSLSYDELMRYSYRLLREHGELSVIVPTDQLGRLETSAAITGFFEKRLCAIRTAVTKPPKRVMVAFAKQPQPEVESGEIAVGDENYKRLLADFYL